MEALEGRRLLSSIAGAPTALAAAEATYGSYISAAFDDVLTRPVDAASLAYFSTRLADGLPLADMATAIVQSDEYLAKVIIQPGYERFLGRPATPADVALWIGELRTGVSDEQFDAALLASDEFYAKAGGTESGWLEAAFQDALSRPPDPAADESFLTQLADGPTPQLALMITTSREREIDEIETDFQQLLNRPAGDAAGYWAGQISQGMSDEQVAVDIATCDEYVVRHTGQPLTTLPQGRDPAWWIAENQQIDDRAQQGNVGLMFLGDSLTYGWTFYADDVWNQYFGQYGPMQAGIPGDTTQNMLWRLQHGNLAGIDPKLVVVMAGTNNLNEGDPTADIAAGVKALLDQIHSELPDAKILLMGITPRGLPDDPMRTLVAQTNQILKGFAGGDISYSDLSSELLDPDGNEVAGGYQPDDAHLTALGYQIWAQAIQTTVAALMES